MGYLAVNQDSQVANHGGSHSAERLSGAEESNLFKMMSVYLYALFGLQLTVVFLDASI